MSRSLVKSRKAVAIKSSKEKWEKSVQSAKVNGKKEIGGFSMVTMTMTKLKPVTVEEAPISSSPFTLVDCMLFSHFSFNDFITIAFPDLTADLDIQI